MTEAPDIDLERLDAANPVSSSELRAGETASDRASLRRSAIRPSRRARPSRPGLRIGGAIAGLAAVGGLATALVISPGGASHLGFAAAAVKVAETNPRLLVTAPGWHVADANSFTTTDGDIKFSDGTHTLELTWYPASDYGLYVHDRYDVDPTPPTVRILGQDGKLFAYSGTDLAIMLPPSGDVFVEIRGDLGSRQAYFAAIDSLKSVDVDTWLAAMPPSVVKPDDRSATIDAMLQDIPVPPGLTLDKVRNDPGVLDRYQLGAAVTGTVTCAWLNRWEQARAADNPVSAKQSVDALSTSHDWAILQEMASEGGWSQEIWRFSDVIASGQLDRQEYQTGLGCDRFSSFSP